MNYAINYRQPPGGRKTRWIKLKTKHEIREKTHPGDGNPGVGTPTRALDTLPGHHGKKNEGLNEPKLKRNIKSMGTKTYTRKRQN